MSYKFIVYLYISGEVTLCELWDMSSSSDEEENVFSAEQKSSRYLV